MESIRTIASLQERLPHGFMLLRSVRDGAGAIVDFEWVYANPAAARIVGRTPDELLGRRLLEEMPGNREEGLFELYARVVETDEPAHRTFHYGHDGLDHWFRVDAVKIDDGFAVQFTDVSAERRLQEQRERALLYQALARAPIAVAVVRGPTFVFEMVNETCAELVGRRDLVGEAMAEAFPELPPDAPLFRIVRRVARTGQPVVAEACPVRIDRQGHGHLEELHLQVTCRPVLADDGTPAVIEIAAVDMTAQVEARREVEELAERLRDSEQRLIEALEIARANAGRFRATFENAAVGIAHVGLDGRWLDFNERLRELVGYSREELLKRTFQDITHPDDLGADLEQAQALAEGRIDSYQLEKRYVRADGSPIWVLLTGSAVRGRDGRPAWRGACTSRRCRGGCGRDRVAVEVRQDGDGVVASIRDGGVGIEPELLTQLFEPFRQAPQDMARSEGGLGLGLALSRSIVELHGGRIEARSSGRGEGAELVVWLPTGDGVRQEAPRCTRTSAGRRVLVVEDNPDTAELVAMLLESCGHQVCHCGNAEEALRLAARHRPDVILTDLGLPGRDGYELARMLRREGLLEGAQLIAVTGYGQPEDRRRSREAGFQHHLVKPVGLDALEAVIGGSTPERS